ncbi:MAG: tripartite tricarboxylate transporter TctB family protein [Tepidimonas ignava]|uniref:Tripartite tricarboxylate transporter TctB family protein n=1 Tax=Tepidimonas ignava TaxID=114249 RepID=A0A4R3LHE4_9BURK|nr:tripartite tricarboxylate transporter TctB family protein [Tepidimonas ignava]MCX7813879.1 tripartite tricarboxylate transporter TctB family protein [Tepidimonas ignava]TCS99020.1 tripartite tricarboxylate transporter TctB family protein [Tepidimonas ignava]TSE22897.1 Tripartite tricarboxylate transporter TctB family protein [Tepidimonas ignava]
MKRDVRDVLGGALMVAVGAGAALYAQQHYELGELRNMGPGFFPVALGWLLAALGVLIALPALLRGGEPIVLAGRAAVAVLGSLVVFGLLLKPAGLVLATVAAVLLASLADARYRWRTRLLTAGVIAALAWLIFIAGLGMVLPTWPWSA